MHVTCATSPTWTAIGRTDGKKEKKKKVIVEGEHTRTYIYTPRTRGGNSLLFLYFDPPIVPVDFFVCCSSSPFFLFGLNNSSPFLLFCFSFFFFLSLALSLSSFLYQHLPSFSHRPFFTALHSPLSTLHTPLSTLPTQKNMTSSTSPPSITSPSPSPAQASPPITLNIRASKGNTYPITLSLTDTVLHLKEQVALASNTASDRIRLVFSGRVLKDTYSIESCKLAHGNVVHMVRSPAAATKTTPAMALASAAVGVQTSIPFNSSPALSVSAPFANPDSRQQPAGTAIRFRDSELFHL